MKSFTVHGERFYIVSKPELDKIRATRAKPMYRLPHRIAIFLKRGVFVPKDREHEYQLMKGKGFTPREAAEVMKLPYVDVKEALRDSKR